jgi:hypothetical protein
VQGAAWNPDFHQFNLNVTQFPTIFRWSELPTAPPNAKTTYMNGTTAPKPKVALKQVAVSPLTGPPTGSRPFDSWPGKMSWRSSTRETDDASSTATHGFHAGIELNHGELSAPSKRDSQQACKYFQKVHCTHPTPQHLLIPPGLLSLRQSMQLHARPPRRDQHQPLRHLLAPPLHPSPRLHRLEQGFPASRHVHLATEPRRMGHLQ